jgi:hypothetical protein
MCLVSIIAMFSITNALPTTSVSPGLRGSLKTTHRDHFSNDNLTINSPIFFYLLTVAEEAQLEEILEAEESVTQEELEFESIDIADEAIIEADDAANDSIEVLPEIDAPNV